MSLAAKLGLPRNEAAALQLAARWHDSGKRRHLWQRSIGNYRFPPVALAKGGLRRGVPQISRYRHELGSLLDLDASGELHDVDPDVRDLTLHLIAAHHGRARPHFPIDETFDPEREDVQAAGAAVDALRAYSRLQRRFGRWGLAYLESLLRAADWMASQRAVESGPGYQAAQGGTP